MTLKVCLITYVSFIALAKTSFNLGIYGLRKNMAPREIQTLTLAGAIKRGWKGGGRIYQTFATFHPVDKITQNFVY